MKQFEVEQNLLLCYIPFGALPKERTNQEAEPSECRETIYLVPAKDAIV